MTGGGGDDVFVFGAGDDRVTDFDVDGDVIDLSALGITAANFAARVAMAQSGDGAVLRIDGQSMTFARSEERRVGKECVSPCSSRWSRVNKKKNRYRTMLTTN